MGPGGQQRLRGWMGPGGSHEGPAGGTGPRRPSRSPLGALGASRRSWTRFQKPQGAWEGPRYPWPRGEKRLWQVSSEASGPGRRLLAQGPEKDRRHAPCQAEGIGRRAQARTCEGSLTGAGRAGRTRVASQNIHQTEAWRGPLLRRSRRFCSPPGRLEPGLGGLYAVGTMARPEHEPQKGAASRHPREEGLILGLPAVLPCSPSPPCQALRISPAGPVSQSAVSSPDEPSSSGEVPGCRGEDSCVP